MNEHKSVAQRPSLTAHASYASSVSRKRPVSNIQCQRPVGAYKLVLAGKGKAALAYHLGVCIRLSETGLLSKFDTILAEDLGCILAVLLRCHWPELCSDISAEGKSINTRSYRYLPAVSVPATMYETSEQQKDIARIAKQSLHNVGSLDTSVPSLTDTKDGSTPPTPVKQSPSINGQERPKRPTLPTTSSVYKGDNKSVFTRKITDPMMDLLLNVDLQQPSADFTDWMTRNSVAFDMFVEEDDGKTKSLGSVRCSVRLLQGDPWLLRQVQPGQKQSDFIDVLPALIWGTKLKQGVSSELFSSIWHAMLAHVGADQRQVTFVTSLADIGGENKTLRAVTGCQCIQETGDRHLHCLKDLLRHELVQQRVMVVETLQCCVTGGLKISTTVSPINRVSESPVSTPPTPPFGPQSSDVIPSHISLPPALHPKPSSSSGGSDEGPTVSRQSIHTRHSLGGRPQDEKLPEWPLEVHRKIETAVLNPSIRGTAHLSMMGSCLNWGYRQTAVYIKKMLQQSPKLCSLNIADRPVVFPVHLQSTIRALSSRANSIDNRTGAKALDKSSLCCC